jgi:hypothetical protein
MLTKTYTKTYIRTYIIKNIHKLHKNILYVVYSTDTKIKCLSCYIVYTRYYHIQGDILVVDPLHIQKRIKMFKQYVVMRLEI